MSGSVDDYHFEWCPRDDPDFRRLNNPVCICDALGDAMKYAEAETLAVLRAKVEATLTHTDEWCGYGADGRTTSACTCERGQVLALFDEEEVPHG